MSTIVFDDDGEVREYIGGYDDWQQQRQQDKEYQAQKNKVATKSVKPVEKKANKKSNLTYQEQLDLAAYPKKIEELDKKQSDLQDAIGQPTFYKQSEAKIAATQAELAAITAELDAMYEKWEALEAKQDA